jgi:hypothetical protein
LLAENIHNAPFVKDYRGIALTWYKHKPM